MPSTNLPSLVVCGSQIGIPDAAYLSRLWSSLAHDAELVGLKRETEQIHDLWSLMVEQDARLERLSASSSIQSLTEWARSGDSTALLLALGTSTVRNTQLAVLTVLAHILEYANYLNVHGPSLDTGSPEPEDGHGRLLQAVQDGGIQGLCIGMLSATAMACSRSKPELFRNGAIAVRLAVCIGAYIDLDSMETKHCMVSVAVRWPPGEDAGKDVLKEALQDTSEASSIYQVFMIWNDSKDPND